MEDLEKLIIYRKYVDLIYYVNMITLKYPKHERFALVNEIKEKTYKGIELIIYAQKEFHKQKRLDYLNQLDAVLKMEKVMIRVSYRNKYITNQNYGAWARKLTDVQNLLYGWIKSCL